MDLKSKLRKKLNRARAIGEVILREKLGKKGQSLTQLKTVSIILGVTVITVSIVAQVLGKVKETQAANSLPANITDLGLESLKTLGDWFPIIAIVVVAVIIIGLLGSAFSRRT